MAILQVRDLDDRIYENLKRIARHNKRSISQEVIHIIETYLSSPKMEKSRNMSKKIWSVAYRIAELFPVIDIERAIMDVFGEIKSSLERRGTTVEDMDLLIAATALSHNLVLVTTNVKHFEKIQDLSMENWKA